MPKRYRPTKQELAAVVFTAALVWVPLGIGGFRQKLAQAKPHSLAQAYEHPAQIKSLTNDAHGIIQIDNKKCYVNETVGECASRIVQDNIIVTYIFLAFLGALQVFIAVGTWCLIRRQAGTLPRLERAYLFVEVVFGETMIQPAHEGFIKCKMLVRFTNHGKTPAILRRILADFDCRETVPTDLLNFPGEELTVPEGLIVPAQGDSEVTPERIVPHDWALLSEPTKALYCFGRIDYRDVLGDEHSTGFCWRYWPFQERILICPETPLNFFT